MIIKAVALSAITFLGFNANAQQKSQNKAKFAPTENIVPVELVDDPNEPTKLYNNIYLYGGSNTMAEYWAEQKEQGLSHIALNLKPTKKPAEETLHEIAENIISKIS